MRLIFWFCIFLSYPAIAQVRLCSWNLCDMGKSKSEAEISFMASTLKDYNLVALQEIVTNPEGAKAVARLAQALNRTGAKWEYCLSPPTSGTKQKRERYAFLWKTAVISKKGDAWLDRHFADVIEREPYFGTFAYRGKTFTVVNFHAITKKLQPETEIKYFKFYPEKYKDLNLVFAGDFNCPASHSVFNPLKKNGFAPALSNVRTTLKNECRQTCTASEFDNFFFKTSTFLLLKTGAADFYVAFPSLHEARKVSDHLPVWMSFEMR